LWCTMQKKTIRNERTTQFRIYVRGASVRGGDRWQEWVGGGENSILEEEVEVGLPKTLKQQKWERESRIGEGRSH